MPATTLRTVAVVLAGGSGSRMDLESPKQLHKVAGSSIIEHTLDALHRCEEIDEILIVMTPAFVERLETLVAHRYPKIRAVIPGGADRNDSTRRAIAALGHEECKVLFHDAVRPFIDRRVVKDCVNALDTCSAVDVVIPSADTIVVVDDRDTVVEVPDRRALRRGQTPQGFLLSTIRKAYELAVADPGFSATDDCSVVLRYLPGTPVRAVAGAEHNIKITYPLDLFIADKLFQFSSTVPIAPPSSDAYRAVLEGRTLVVFGGSYGIGGELVTLARSLGANVVSFSRSETGTDIADPRGIEEALQRTHAEHGRIDFIVNAAAILTRGPVVEMTVRAIEEQMAVNYLAPILIARAGLGYLRQTGGHLLLFTSSSYTRGRAEYSLYSSTKAAVVNLMQALADEWSALRVHVNCINPERTQTPMRLRSFGPEPEETLLSAQTVARSALDVLCSDMTGQVVDVRRPAGTEWLAPTGAPLPPQKGRPERTLDRS